MFKRLISLFTTAAILLTMTLPTKTNADSPDSFFDEYWSECLPFHPQPANSADIKALPTNITNEKLVELIEEGKIPK